jgi:hypothetical protein
LSTAPVLAEQRSHALEAIFRANDGRYRTKGNQANAGSDAGWGTNAACTEKAAPVPQFAEK